MANKIPSQVDEAAELAEKLHAEMFSTQPDEVIEEEPETEFPASDDTPVVEDDDVIPHDDDVEELRKYKARYLSLKGKYDAEVPRLQHDLREFKENVFSKLTTLAETPPQTQQEVKQENDLITRLRGEYGEEFIDSMRLLAQTVAEESNKDSLKSVTDKVTSVEDTQLKMAQEDFMTYVDTKATDKNWRKLVNGEDPKFIEFLGKPDPRGLYTFGELLQTYNDHWEADKLAILLNIYTGEKPATTIPPVVPKPPVQKPEREAMVAPSRTTAHVAPDVTEKQIWTKDMIKEFERLDRQGKFTSEESQAKWNDLMTAPMEGRLR